MIDFKEFIRRSMDGPVMAEQEFDVKLSRELRRLAADYALHFKPTEVICDDVSADAIFRAGVELLGRVGLYNVDTNRVILLTREELAETCRDTPKQFTRGAGKDAVMVAARAHDSRVPPYMFRWPLFSERYRGGREAFLSEMIEAHLCEPGELGNLARELKVWLNGVVNKAGTVGDTIWAVAVARWSLATARAMRMPDMFLGHCVPVTVPAILGSFMGEQVFQKHHASIAVHVMPELKINWERLQLAFVARQMGAPRHLGVTSVLGAYARNAEETAIVSTASLLAQLSYAAADWIMVGTVDLEGYRTRRPTLQAASGALRAAERNIGVATGAMQTTKNGLGSASSLYEKVAITVVGTCSGVSWSWYYPLHPGPNGEPKTDLECELATRVVRAVSGMGAEEATELVGRLLGLYVEHWDHPEPGKPYAYCYDLRTLTPKQELVDLHRRVEEKLISLGVPLGG